MMSRGVTNPLISHIPTPNPMMPSQIVVVSTLASFTPASPFIFRSYELPVEAEQLAAKMGACTGSSKHTVWQVSSLRYFNAAINPFDYLAHPLSMIRSTHSHHSNSEDPSPLILSRHFLKPSHPLSVLIIMMHLNLPPLLPCRLSEPPPLPPTISTILLWVRIASRMGQPRPTTQRSSQSSRWGLSPVDRVTDYQVLGNP